MTTMKDYIMALGRAIAFHSAKDENLSDRSQILYHNRKVAYGIV